MSQPKLTLNLNEQNELAFKISIEGSSSDIDATKPNIRFLVREGGKETGWVYPATPGDDGFVVVNIPNNGLFSEEKSYKGKLEVILGNHYFVPTEVEMEFIKPLKVEAAVVTNNSTISETTNSLPREKSVSVATVQVRNKARFDTVKPNKKKSRRKWDDLSEAEQHRVKKLLVAKKKKELREAKEVRLRNKKAKEKRFLLEEKKLKNQIKSLMATSLLDE